MQRVRVASLAKRHQRLGDELDRYTELRAARPLDRYALAHGAAHLLRGSETDSCDEACTSGGHSYSQIVEDFGYHYTKLAQLGVEGLDGLIAECAVLHVQDFQRPLMSRRALFGLATPEWPAERILLQVAVESSPVSLYRRAAVVWLQQNPTGHYWLRRIAPFGSDDEGTRALLQTPMPQPTMLCRLARVSEQDEERVLVGNTESVVFCRIGPRSPSWGPLVPITPGPLQGIIALPDGTALGWSSEAWFQIDSDRSAVERIPWTGSGELRGALGVEGGGWLAWTKDGKVIRVDAHHVVRDACEVHRAAVNGAFPLSKDEICSWSEDGTLRRWSWQDRFRGLVIEAHEQGVHRAVRLRDGTVVTTGYGEMVPVRWNLETGEAVCRYEHAAAAWDVAAGTDEVLLFAMGDAATIRCTLDGTSLEEEFPPVTQFETAPVNQQIRVTGFARNDEYDLQTRDTAWANSLVSWLGGKVVACTAFGEQGSILAAVSVADGSVALHVNGQLRVLAPGWYGTSHELEGDDEGAPLRGRIVFDRDTVMRATAIDPARRGEYSIAPPQLVDQWLPRSLFHLQNEAAKGRSHEEPTRAAGNGVDLRDGFGRLLARWVSDVGVEPDWLLTSGTIYLDGRWRTLELQLYRDAEAASLPFDPVALARAQNVDDEILVRLVACRMVSANRGEPGLENWHHRFVPTRLRNRAQQTESLVVLPAETLLTISELQRCMRYLAPEFGRLPSLDEMAEMIELPVRKVRAVLRFIDHARNSEDRPTSLDDKPDGLRSWGLPETSVVGLLKLLPWDEEKKIRKRFGIGAKSDHTFEEVGQGFEVTRERIRQIEAQSLRRLSQKE